MTERVALSNTLRFEVFKRDRFTCQYCGGKAPDVVLNADHINPVAAGGTNDLMNLTTSCVICNSGKSDRLLADDSAVVVARAQAEIVEERRQQVRMMADWQVELSRMDVEIDAIDEAVGRIANRHLKDKGKREMRLLVRKFGVQEVIAAIAIAYDRYEPEDAYAKIKGICHSRRMEREDPEAAAVYYLINRLGCIVDYGGHLRYRARDLLLEIARDGVADLEWFYRHVSGHRAAFRHWESVCQLFEHNLEKRGR